MTLFVFLVQQHKLLALVINSAYYFLVGGTWEFWLFIFKI